jgi:hypothetical protein
MVVNVTIEQCEISATCVFFHPSQPRHSKYKISWNTKMLSAVVIVNFIYRHKLEFT